MLMTYVFFSFLSFLFPETSLSIKEPNPVPPRKSLCIYFEMKPLGLFIRMSWLRSIWQVFSFDKETSALIPLLPHFFHNLVLSFSFPSSFWGFFLSASLKYERVDPLACVALLSFREKGSLSAYFYQLWFQSINLERWEWFAILSSTVITCSAK